MAWLLNKFREVEVTAWNEENATTLDGGKSIRSKSDDITLSILIMRTGSMFFYEEEGRFQSDGIEFQVDSVELSKNDFTITSGKTHIEQNGNTYRVMEVTDYTAYVFNKLMQCKCVKILDVD